MRKKISLLLVAVMSLSIVACSKTEKTQEPTPTPTTETNISGEVTETPDPETTPTGGAQESENDSLDLLNTVWAAYSEDEKFPAAGGDYSEENMTMDGPGRYAIDAEGIEHRFGFPAANVSMIDNVASLGHMMNENTFTSAVYHVVNADDVATLCETIRTNIQGKTWMCGFPDKLVIITVDNYIISAFGHQETIDTFKENVQKCYDNAQVVAEEAITF